MFEWQPDQLPILQLGPDFYDPVSAAHFPEQKLRYWNSTLNLQFNKNHFVDFEPLQRNLQSPLALRYHGHQFQNYNPQLGDGRGFLFAQIQQNGQWYDLGTKGSGQTPYSRGGDGRLTLKGALREALATEMLEALGVRTSKTLCFFETGERLERNDEPSPTRSAVLTRFSLGHIRIGTFQRLAYNRQIDHIKKLTDYCLYFYYYNESRGIDRTDENLVASRFLQLVVSKNAELVAQVMMAGFVHGVLNTDNINISGELFDYGPYRFMPAYDPNFTAAYFDHHGLYSYGRQPHSFLWALHQLAGCLQLAYPQLAAAEILNQFSEAFGLSVQKEFCRQLNIKPLEQNQTEQLLSQFFQMMEQYRLPFAKTFYDFKSKQVLNTPSLISEYEKMNPDILRSLEKFELADESVALAHLSLNTLLIDEIEAIWRPIDLHDDWQLFEEKVKKIRQLRPSAYKSSTVMYS